MKIGILGGAFDPPHNGHVLLARQIKKYSTIDKIWLVPCGLHPFHKKLSSPTDRLAMLLLVKDSSIHISDYEIRQNKTTYTIDTLNAFSQQYPEHTFHLIIGSDNIKDFPRWKNWKKLIQQYPIIIFPRTYDYAKIEKEIKDSFQLKTIPSTITLIKDKNMEISKISSTEIRNSIHKNQLIKNTMSESIYNYIVLNKLYI